MQRILILTLVTAALLAWGCVIEDSYNRELQKAARRGDLEAQYNLGLRYSIGERGNISPREAAEWFGRAADQGHPGAQYQMGRLYELGQGLEPDPKTAAYWYKLAAENTTQSDAQYALARSYLAGSGVERDLGEAYFWLSVAAQNGHPEASKDRATMNAYLNPEFIKDTGARVDKWFAKRR